MAEGKGFEPLRTRGPALTVFKTAEAQGFELHKWPVRRRRIGRVSSMLVAAEPYRRGAVSRKSLVRGSDPRQVVRELVGHLSAGCLHPAVVPLQDLQRRVP